MKLKSTITWTLLIAVTASLFTQLRIAFFGVGEILILLVFASTLSRPIKRTHLKKFLFTKFWAVYLLLSIVGAFSNFYILDNSTSTPIAMLYDFSAYVFLLITCFTFERLFFEEVLDAKQFLIYLFYFSAAVLSMLYIRSFFTESLFGYTLIYYTHFSPLAINVHQTAMYIVVLPFVGIATIAASTGLWKRLVAVVLIMFAVAMSISAATTKADLALIVGAIALAYGYSLKGAARRFRIPVNVAYIILIMIALQSTDSVGLFQSFFTEADTPDGARRILYSGASEVILESPIFGHGPGPHVMYSGKFFDVHQTHLSIMLQAGILGLLVYVLFTIKFVSRIWRDPSLLAAFCSIFVYSAGGDVLRRLPIWVLLMLAYYWRSSSSVKPHFSRSVRRVE